MVCADAYRVECDIRDPEAVARECRRLEEKLDALKAPELPPSPSLLLQLSQIKKLLVKLSIVYKH